MIHFPRSPAGRRLSAYPRRSSRRPAGTNSAVEMEIHDARCASPIP